MCVMSNTLYSLLCYSMLVGMIPCTICIHSIDFFYGHSMHFQFSVFDAKHKSNATVMESMHPHWPILPHSVCMAMLIQTVFNAPCSHPFKQSIIPAKSQAEISHMAECK